MCGVDPGKWCPVVLSMWLGVAGCGGSPGQRPQTRSERDAAATDGATADAAMTGDAAMTEDAAITEDAATISGGDAPSGRDGPPDPEVAIVTPPTATCRSELRPRARTITAAGLLPATSPFELCGALGSEGVVAVRFSPDGSRLAVVGTSGQVHLLDADTLAIIDTFARPRGPYAAVAFSHDGLLLAMLGRDGELDLWRWAEHQVAQAVDLAPRAAGRMMNLQFSADNSVVVATGGATVAIVDVKTGAARALFDRGAVNTLEVAADGTRLVLGTNGYIHNGNAASGFSLDLYDTATGGAIANFGTTQYELIDAAVIAGGAAIVTTSVPRAPGENEAADPALGIYDAHDGRFIRRVSLVAEGRLVAISADDRLALMVRAADSSTIAETLDLADGHVTARLAIGSGAVAVSPDFSRIAIIKSLYGNAGPALTVVDLAGTTSASSCAGPASPTVAGASADGTRALMTSPTDSYTQTVASVVDVDTDDTLGSVTVDRALGSNPTAAFSPDGGWAALTTGGAPVQIQLWSLADGTSRFLTIADTGASPVVVAFSRDSTLVAAAVAGSPAGVWRVGDATPVSTFGPTDGDPLAIAFDPTAASVVVLSATHVARWRVQDGAMVESRQVAAGLALSPDATRLSDVEVVYPLRIVISQVAEAQPTVALCCTDGTAGYGAVWSPDGGLLAIPDQLTVPNAIGFGPFVRVWNTATGELVATVPTTSGWGVAISGDSRRIAVGTSVWCRR
jgi:WD40 repeat protein